MIRKLFLILAILGVSSVIVHSQSFERSVDLFKRNDGSPHGGQLNIIQDPAIRYTDWQVYSGI